MTTLIIEPKKEPQDVPGVVIPPPGVSEPVIKNTPEDMLRELYCAGEPERYKKCLIQPVGQIN